MQILFWFSLLVLLYTFLGYPLLLKLLVVMRPDKKAFHDDFYPVVSIILSVYNEETVIREKIENFFTLEYPQNRIEFVIVSDGCSDKTEDIIRSYDSNRISLFVQKQRGGKTLALNRAVSEATGEILIFTDANSMFTSDAIKKLSRHFADPTMGLVSGRSIYLNAQNTQEELGGAYRNYEERIKADESRVCSIVGADGAIYAMRKELYEQLKPEYINDFIHTFQIVLRGYRAVSDPAAICREAVDETHEGELNRQTRIMAQSWLILMTQMPKLISRFKLMYLWEIVSHKFLRWLTVPFISALFVSAMLLRNESVIYSAMFISLVVFIVLASLGRLINSGLMRIPYMFALLHVAALLGLFKYLSGNKFTTWNPRTD